MVGEGNRKYRKKDFNSYEGVVHVACKPPLTRTIVKNKDCKPRRPLTDILAVIDGKNTWITYSDLTAICGKDDALVDIEEYYDDRELEYPWDVPPKRTLKVIERKESDGPEDFSSANETTTSKASAGSSWNPVNGNTTNGDSSTQKSGNDEMQSQLNEMQSQLNEQKEQYTQLQRQLNEQRTQLSQQMTDLMTTMNALAAKMA